MKFEDESFYDDDGLMKLRIVKDNQEIICL